MAEFALVGGLFFFLMFSIVNAGVFLYGRNTIDYTADVGVAEIAAMGQGNVQVQLPNGTNAATGYNVDQVAIQWMDADGLTALPLTKVTSIAICKQTQNADGSFTNSGECNTYSQNGTAQGTTGGGWAQGSRNVSSATGPDFGSLTINYQYQLVASNTMFTITNTTMFRLEPEQ